MAKRFTDSHLYDHAWFRRLPPRLKCAWEWLRLRCDAIGCLTLDMDRMSFEIGEPVTLEELEVHFKVQIFDSDKLYIPGFVPFQYGDESGLLSPGNNFHKSIAAKLQARGFPTPEFKSIDTHLDGCPHPSDTHPDGLGKGQGRGRGIISSSSRGGVGEKKPKRKRTPEVFLPSDAAELLAGMTDSKRKTWKELYPDDDFIKREVTKAFSYYHDDNPKDEPRSRAGWSRALSYWFDKGWKNHRQGHSHQTQQRAFTGAVSGLAKR